MWQKTALKQKAVAERLFIFLLGIYWALFQAQPSIVNNKQYK